MATTHTPKICPIKMIERGALHEKYEYMLYCLEEKCAWWYEGSCAVINMTYSLSALNTYAGYAEDRARYQ